MPDNVTVAALFRRATGNLGSLRAFDFSSPVRSKLKGPVFVVSELSD